MACDETLRVPSAVVDFSTFRDVKLHFTFQSCRQGENIYRDGSDHFFACLLSTAANENSSLHFFTLHRLQFISCSNISFQSELSSPLFSPVHCQSSPHSSIPPHTKKTSSITIQVCPAATIFVSDQAFLDRWPDMQDPCWHMDPNHTQTWESASPTCQTRVGLLPSGLSFVQHISPHLNFLYRTLELCVLSSFHQLPLSESTERNSPRTFTP